MPGTIFGGEVDQLSAAGCEGLGLRIEQPTTEQLLEAAAVGGPLSFQDWLCLIAARDRGEPRRILGSASTCLPIRKTGREGA